MSRVLLDTNTLLDYVLPDRPDSNQAVQLVLSIIHGEQSGVIAASSLKDFYYITRKYLSEQERRDWIGIFIRLFDIEHLDAEVCSIALESDEPDYEDGCIRAIAERAQVDFIITRDREAFARSWIKTYAPREFAELFLATDEQQDEA